MSNPGDADDTPIASVQQLADHIAAGCKPAVRAYRIGTEHEKFGFACDTRRPPPYEPGGIRAVLDGLTAPGAVGADPGERAPPSALKGAGTNRSASVSLEPAGQLELSGAPLVETLHETEAELARRISTAVRPVARDAAGAGVRADGASPDDERGREMPWMPKGRYAIMRRYMPLVGQLGLDMMQRTCTVQVNLDYSSEADMARKLRVSLALQPVATALFANSPFIVEGKPSGYPVQPGAGVDGRGQPTAAGCRRRCSRRGSGSSGMSSGCWTCRCISCCATGVIPRRGRAVVPAVHGGGLAACCRACGRRWGISRIT